MTLTKRHFLKAVLFFLSLWLVYQVLHYYRITHPNRNHAMIKSLRNMQPFCVGRFLINLPEGTTVRVNRASVEGAEFSAEAPVSHSKFELLMEKRWAEIEAIKVDDNGKPFIQVSKRIEPRKDAVIFNYQHVMIRSADIETGADVERHLHKTEAYFWQDNTLYSFTSDPADDAVLKTIQALHKHNNSQTPSGPGFCGPDSFFVGGAKPESLSIAFRLPTQPPIDLYLDTSTYYSAETGQLQVPPRPKLSDYENENFKGMTLRDAPRTVSGLAGKEWIEGTTQKRGDDAYETNIDATWFYPGEMASSGKPAIEARYGITYKTTSPPSPWGSFPKTNTLDGISEETFMTYWDTILGTLRLRPGALNAGDK